MSSDIILNLHGPYLPRISNDMIRKAEGQLFNC